MSYLHYDERIEVLGFSSCTYACLKKANIHSVIRLLEYPKDEFCNIEMMDEASVQEVFDRLD